MSIQEQARLSRLERENAAFQEIACHLRSIYGTPWHRLTPRDFYGRLPNRHEKVDGCLLCEAEAHKHENGRKSYANKDDCPLVILGIVERNQAIEVNW